MKAEAEEGVMRPYHWLQKQEVTNPHWCSTVNMIYPIYLCFSFIFSAALSTNWLFHCLLWAFFSSQSSAYVYLWFSHSLSFIRMTVIFLDFILRPMIYFELIFVKNVQSLSTFFFFRMWMSCSSTICWKDNLFLVVLSLLLGHRSKISWLYLWSLFMGSSLFHWSICLLFRQ